jgi:hypothetical protein
MYLVPHLTSLVTVCSACRPNTFINLFTTLFLLVTVWSICCPHTFINLFTTIFLFIVSDNMVLFSSSHLSWSSSLSCLSLPPPPPFPLSPSYTNLCAPPQIWPLFFIDLSFQSHMQPPNPSSKYIHLPCCPTMPFYIHFSPFPS